MEAVSKGDEMRWAMLLCFSVLKLEKTPSSLVKCANLGQISLYLGNQLPEWGKYLNLGLCEIMCSIGCNLFTSERC